jgi:hypothetical protein
LPFPDSSLVVLPRDLQPQTAANRKEKLTPCITIASDISSTYR